MSNPIFGRFDNADSDAYSKNLPDAISVTVPLDNTSTSYDTVAIPVANPVAISVETTASGDLYGRYLISDYSEKDPTRAWRHNNWDHERHQLREKEKYLNDIMPGRIDDFIEEFENKYNYEQLSINDTFVEGKDYYTLRIANGNGEIKLIKSRCERVWDDNKQCELKEDRVRSGISFEEPIEQRNVSLRPIYENGKTVTTNVVWRKKTYSLFKSSKSASKIKDHTFEGNKKKKNERDSRSSMRNGGKKSKKSRKNNNRRKTKKHKNHKKSRRKGVH